MGTFEKLGILVIVVIIVMILAVAIYQWGGSEADSPLAVGSDGVPDLVVKDITDYTTTSGDATVGGAGTDGTKPDVSAKTWPGGVPRTYTIRKNDNLWVLVFSKWRLRDSFIKEIARANPGLNPKRLRPGDKLVIPDPAGFFRDKQGSSTSRARDGATVYEVQIGDTLETIARMHLGRKNRWHEIVDLNPGLRPERLRPGQKILLPALR